MPVLSFANPVPTPDAVAPAPAGALVPATAPGPLAPAAAAFASPASQITGDLSGVSEPIPYLALAQKTSKCVEDDPSLMGKYVYDKSTRLGPPTDPKLYAPDIGRDMKPDSILGIVTKADVFYEEVVDYDSGIIPNRWKTAAEARASGLPFHEVGVIDILIATDIDHEQTVIVADLPFLRARFFAKKAAFRNVAGVVIRDSRTWLAGDTCSGLYEFTSVKMTGKNTYWTPGLKAAGKTPDALRAAIREEFGV